MHQRLATLLTLSLSATHSLASPIVEPFESEAAFVQALSPASDNSGNFDWSASAGVGDSGGLTLPTEPSSDAIYSSRQTYSMEDDGEYRLSGYFYSQANNGYGSIGFATAPVNSISRLYAAASGDNIGVSFHGAGGHWWVNGLYYEVLDWPQGFVLSDVGEWYKVEMRFTPAADNEFTAQFSIYSVDQTTGAVLQQEFSDESSVTNANLRAAGDVHAFFGTERDRFSRFDNFSIEVNDSVDIGVVPVRPTARISAEGLTNGAVSYSHPHRFTFELTEPTDDFTASDITVLNGTIDVASFAGSATTYTVDVAPNSVGEVTLSVAADQFVGNTSGLSNRPSSPYRFDFQGSLTRGDPTQAVGVKETLNAMHQASHEITRHSLNSVNERLRWLKRNPQQRSHQGIALRSESQFIDSMLNGATAKPIDQAALLQLLNSQTQDDKAIAEFSQAQLTRTGLTHLRQELGLSSLDLNPTGGPVLGEWSAWSSGQVRLGKTPGTSGLLSFDSQGITLGLDKPHWDDQGVLGLAMSLGQTEFDRVHEGSETTAQHLSLSMYGARPLKGDAQIEAALGVGTLDFDTQRIDADQRLLGKRPAQQVFGSVSVRGSQIIAQHYRSSPYFSVEASHTRLAAYTERGGDRAIHFEKQHLQSTQILLGQDITLAAPGRWAPYARMELGLDVSGGSTAHMRYAAESARYALAHGQQRSAQWTLGVGADYQLNDTLTFSSAYQRTDQFNRGYTDQLSAQVTYVF